MKTPKAERLPSGNWRIKVQIDGKRYSCTAPTKKEAQDKAAKLYAGIQMEKRSPLTLGKAIDRYIISKADILSPSTIAGYKKIRRNDLQSIMDVNISELTTALITKAVNEDSLAGKSDKTIKNAHGLVTATLSEFRPDFVSRAKMPSRKKKKEVVIPTEADLKKIWEALKGGKYELPILIASWMGLRSSEIQGLKFSDIQNGRLHVQRAVVKGEEGRVEKKPKTAAGDRWLYIPEVIQKLIDQIPHESDDEYIIKSAPNSIYHVFIKTCREVGVEPCRMHDLRHFVASEAHSLGIPDKYISQMMGHSGDNMLKTVYEHAMRDKMNEFETVMNNHMKKLYEKL